MVHYHIPFFFSSASACALCGRFCTGLFQVVMVCQAGRADNEDLSSGTSRALSFAGVCLIFGIAEPDCDSPS